jgi:hypothetical protein
LALLLVACGGTSARAPKRSPGAGGAAGEPSAAAGAVNALPAEGGAGGAGLGVGGAVGGADAGAAGTPGAEAGAAGAAGAGGQPACVGLDCLAGAELLYVPDRAWQRPTAAPNNTSAELSETDYTPLAGPTWLAKFSSDAQALDLTPSAGGDTIHGTRDPQRQDQAWFELSLFAGGRFLVWASANELHAEYTSYGSGMPIVSSTRGLLETP